VAADRRARKLAVDDIRLNAFQPHETPNGTGALRFEHNFLNERELRRVRELKLQNWTV
jgi:hypothetical protein